MSNKYLRSSNSILEPFESKYIDPLSRFIPNWLETYHLTMMTILWCILIIYFSFLARENISYLWIVSLVILFQYITDRFDGLIGRQRNTGLVKWGFYMDHFLDFIFLCSIVIGYSFLLPDEYKVLAFFTMGLFTAFMFHSILYQSATGKFQISFYGIGPTEIRLAIIIVNTFLIVSGTTGMGWLLPLVLTGGAFALANIVYQAQKEIWQIDLGKTRPNWLQEKIEAFQRLFITKDKHIIPSKIPIPLTRLSISLISILTIGFSLAIFFYITNPFNEFNLVSQNFEIVEKDGQFNLITKTKPKVIKNQVARGLAFVKAGFHIIANAWTGSTASNTTYQVDSVINDTYKLRYNEKYQYLITGDHFSMLYPRNLGSFYGVTLDRRIDKSDQIWDLKQRSILKSTALALEVLKQNGEPCTTISPLGFEYYACFNVYAYPSDTLYGLLYSIKVMQDGNEIARIYPYMSGRNNILKTKRAAQKLLQEYKPTLAKLVDDYYKKIYNKDIGLINEQAHLSGMKDSTRRYSGFYDNVILWRTLQLADELNIYKTDPTELAAYKKRILQTFWLDKEGYFLEDLSIESIKNKYYSSDWLVVVFTGFLDTKDIKEQTYIKRSLEYIRKQKIDQPFGLHYHSENRRHRQEPIVGLFLPEYGGSAIWSYWGTEYIKTLLLMYQSTKDSRYLKIAREQLDKYRNNIEKYGGFSETYNKDGEMLKTLFYRSVLKTGWIVNYDQAELMYKSLAN